MNKKQKELAIEVKGITKSYPGVVANKSVDFTVNKGEIHALVGENGAGKSTLMKILYGIEQADEGEVSVNGNVVQINKELGFVGNPTKVKSSVILNEVNNKKVAIIEAMGLD